MTSSSTTTATTPTCEPDLTLSICGPNELRVSDACTHEVRQKYVDAVGGSLDTHWTFDELKNLGAMLHEAPEFKTQKFMEYKNLMTNLGITLAHPTTMTRASLVQAMLPLMKQWFDLCNNDDQCVPPPSRATLANESQRKVIQTIDRLKRALIQEKLDNVRLQQGRTPAITPAPEYVALQQAEEAADAARKT